MLSAGIMERVLLLSIQMIDVCPCVGEEFQHKGSFRYGSIVFSPQNFKNEDLPFTGVALFVYPAIQNTAISPGVAAVSCGFVEGISFIPVHYVRVSSAIEQ